MASLGFKDWAVAEGVANSASIDQLRGKRIAVSAEDYLKSLLTTTLTREPLLPALGGLPFALQKHVDANLQSFRDASISPFFVFGGLDVACRDRASLAKESRKAARSLDDAWSLYNQSRADDAVAEFGRSCNYRTYHILRWLQTHLHHNGIRTQTAPYSADAQMVYLESAGFIDALVGSAPCLINGAEKVIISFDWETHVFVWVEKRKCLSKLLVSDDQFIDLCLLSGYTSLSALPELDVESPMPRIQAARNLMSRFNDGHAVCMQAKDDDYLALFRKARAALRYMVILTADGEIKPRNSDSMPGDIHEVIGQRLPDELYFYLSRGVVGPRMLNWRTRMELFETPPLDGGNSPAYKELVQKKLAPLRAKALAIMTHSLNRYYQKKDVDLVTWFSEAEKRPLNIPDVLEPTKAAEGWHVKETVMAKAAVSDQVTVTASPLVYAVSLPADDAAAKKTVTPRTESSSLEKPNELLANTVWRFLQDREYINPDHTLSAWGKALKSAFDRAKRDGYLQQSGTSNEAEEAVFMAFELIRLDILNTSQLFPSPPYSGAPIRGSETDKAFTLLLSRIASLGTFRHEEIGFTGPLSRNLLAYHQMAAAVRGALRDLVEMHACSMLLQGSVSRDLAPKQYTDLGCALPFIREPDLGLSLVVKSYLDELSNESSRRSDISRWFSHALDIGGDLQKTWKMWAAINAGVQAADTSIIKADIKNMFHSANLWLEQKLEGAPTTNGTS